MFRSPFSSKKTLNSSSPKRTSKRATDEVPNDSIKAASQSLPPSAPTHDEKNKISTYSSKGEIIEVYATLNVYTTTWNMSNIAVIEEEKDVQFWIPKGFDVYGITVQECKKYDSLENVIHEFIGGSNSYHKFKTKDISGTALLVFVDQVLIKSGVFKNSHINGITRHEIKGGALSSSTGRGAITMQFSFHNTALAFVACKLDSKSPEKRVSDLEYILKETGIESPDTQDVGTPTLHKVHHVFLMGDFGTKIVYPPKSSLKGLAPATDARNPWTNSRWENLLEQDEMAELRKKVKSLRSFAEIPICYPPTCMRRREAAGLIGGSADSVKGRKTLSAVNFRGEILQNIASIYDPLFNIEELFDFKAGGQSSLPAYSDRILFRTLKDFHHLVTPQVCGSNDAIQSSYHVPVYATFLINGIDNTLLQSWQKISGNIPPELSTRADDYLVNYAIVDQQAQELVQEKTNVIQASPQKHGSDKETLHSTEKICGICTKPLLTTQRLVELPDGQTFHADCFKCSNCQKSLLEVKFVNIDGHWLCEEDYMKLYVKACPRCKKTISGPFLRSGDHQYHRECFICSKPHCNKALIDPNGDFLEFDELDGKPFCMEHYLEIRETLTFCACCNRIIRSPEVPISFSQIVHGNEETVFFHSSCFHCQVCHLNLDKSSKKFIIKDEAMYCEDDFRALYGNPNSTPTTPSVKKTLNESADVPNDVHVE